MVALLTEQQPVMAAWQRIVGRAGFQAVAQAQDLRPVNLAEDTCTLGDYFVKSGWDAAAEIACGSLKTARTGNMTPMALLRNFTATGDADALELWHEWETDSANRRQMTWSRGLRDRLQLLACKPDDALADDADDGAEQTDEDIAGSQDRGDKPVLLLDASTWRRVRSTDLLWRLLETAEDEPALLSGRSDDNPWGNVA